MNNIITKKWYSCAKVALFLTGFLSIVMAFGDDELPIGYWLLSRIVLFTFGYLCFRGIGFIKK